MGEKDGSICLKAGGIIADIIFDRADTYPFFEGKHADGFGACADQCGTGERLRDCPAEKRIVGTAEDEGINAGFTDRSKITLTGEKGNGIAFG